MDDSNMLYAVLTLVVLCTGWTQAQITGARCGETPVTTRIIGGSNIPYCQWPFTPLVSLKIFYNDQPGASTAFGNLTICGGAIINSQYILTSAICAAPLYGPEGTAIRIGSRVIVGDFDTTTSDFGNDGTPEGVIEIEDVKIHYGYNNFTTDHNIAILKLARPINYNNCKMPGCLKPQQSERNVASCSDEVDSTCVMAAVGLKAVEDENAPNIPQQAPIKMFSRAVTEAIMRATPANILPMGAVLGETFSPSVQACLFDWGGIVVCQSEGTYFLRGLISTNNCLLSNNPDTRPPPIFITEVAQYRNWMDRCVADFNSCASLPF